MEVVYIGLLSLIGVIGGIVWSELAKLRKVKPKLNGEGLSILVDLARVAVSAAETVGGDGDQKYKLASEALVELAARVGLTLSEVEVAALIHAVLKEVAPKFEDDLR